MKPSFPKRFTCSNKHAVAPTASSKCSTAAFLRLDFTANDQMPALARLLRRYADLPMSFADACLVSMTELDEKAGVFTLDRDFLVYRKNNRQG